MMPKQLHRPPTQSVSKKNSGLLFQFILFELTLAFKECSEILGYTSEVRNSKINKDRFEKISSGVTKLTGQIAKTDKVFNLCRHQGILPKLKQHADCFISYLDPQDSDAETLRGHIDQAWTHFLYSFPISLPTDSGKNTLDLSSVQHSIQQVQDHVRSVADTAARFLRLFHHDENVLLFLIRHQEQLAPLFEKGFIKRFLEDLFPSGAEEVRSFLVHRFTRRGFSHLAPVISKQVNHLYD